MKYFIDTHDKTKGSFPQGVLTEQAFLDQFNALEAAAVPFHVGAHAAVHLPYDSITEVKRVTGADLRLPRSTEAHPRHA